MGNVFATAVLLFSTAAWLNHIVATYSEQLWAFMIAGAIIFPVGVSHGIWLWFQ